MLMPTRLFPSHLTRLVAVLLLAGGVCLAGWSVRANRMMRAGFASGWRQMPPLADYLITNNGGALVITDATGNSDTLNISEPSAGTIIFGAGGRTFSVNNGSATTDSSGDIALTGITSITVNQEQGNDTANIGSFSVEMPSLTLNGGTGDDVIVFNGSINFAADAHLDVDLQNDDATPGIDRVDIENNANLALNGTGRVTIKVSRSVRVRSLASLSVVDGDLLIEANQQTPITAGNFTGVTIAGIEATNISGSSSISSYGMGKITVKGRGGEGTNSNCYGVRVENNGGIWGGGGTVTVMGQAGTLDGQQGVGVYLYFRSGIDSVGGDVVVTGTGAGGVNPSIGVLVTDESYIFADQNGTVMVTGISGVGSGGFNEGVGVYTSSSIGAYNGDVMVQGTGRGTGDHAVGVDVYDYSEVFAGNAGHLTILGTGGDGPDSYGVWINENEADLSAGSGMTVTAIGGAGATDLLVELGSSFLRTADAPIVVNADSIALNSSTYIEAQAGSVTLRPRTNGTAIDLGGADAPNVLGLDAEELGNVSGANLYFGSAASGPITISTPFIRASATNLHFIAGGAIHLNYPVDTVGGNATFTTATGVNANVVDVDVVLGTTGTLSFGSASGLPIVINGTTPNTAFQQLSVSGEIDLTGVNLVTSGTYTPQVGDSFLIVDNDGTEALHGTFNGLPQNASIFGFLGTSLAARISYTGGTGNDVVLTVYAPDTPPTISTASFSPLMRQQGAVASNASIATVNDAQTAAGSLAVTVTSANPSNGVTLANLANNNGTITANVVADCTATDANFTLTVTDGSGQTGNATLNVIVTANTPPTIGNYATVTVSPGGSTSVTPSATPADNGTLMISATASAGFTGTLTPNNTSGEIAITNAGPAGMYTITVTVADNCNATTQKMFMLIVNTAPTISPAAGLSRQSGSSLANSQIALVNDADGAVGTLTVMATPLTGSGVTLNNITNTDGAITADIVAACGATASTFNLTVTDNKGATATMMLSVAVTANTNPTVGAYANTTLSPGSSTTVTPNAAPADNGTIASVVAVASAGFTGSFSQDIVTGGVTINNAGPAGMYTITVTVTDNCGTTAQQTFMLTVNTVPTIMAASGLSQQQGSPAAATQIATVNDADGGVGSLSVIATPLMGTGVTLSNLANNNGVITADVLATCSATNATFTLTVTDNKSATSTATLNIAVVANASPTLGSYADTTLVPGGGVTLTPSAPLSDNGSATIAAVASAGFTGSFAYQQATGELTINNAGPAGMYTITVTATDNCNATSQQTFMLTVNTAPTIMAASGVSRQQGSSSATTQIATVNDAEGNLGTLGVQVNGSAMATVNGVTVTNLVNTNGVITADVVAACGATDASFNLTVTDNKGATATTMLSVTVTANTDPTVGNYANASVAVNGNTTVTPTTTPADNGSVQSVTAAASAGFTGTLGGEAMNGSITVTNAAPAGIYTITVTVTDNCGATVQKTFALTVNNAPTINAVAITPQQGSPSANLTIANVNDTDQVLNSLVVTVNGAATATVNGVSLANLSVNAVGVVTADVSAACGATNASFTLAVTDDKNVTVPATLNVTVTANSDPTLGSYADTTLVPGGGGTITPSAPLSDNGSATIAAVASAGFTGSFAYQQATGELTINNAGPAGMYTITVMATDNCNATLQRTFMLTVNTAPTIMAASSVSRQQGSPSATTQIATVNDAEGNLGTLGVQVNGSAMATVNGVTVTNLVNTNGAITAAVVAACGATDASFNLTVTDNKGATATTMLSVTVTANTNPTIGTFSDLTLLPGAGMTVSPSVAPADNGTIASVSAAAPNFAGMFSGDTTTGVITISNAGPVGVYPVTVTVTDNCGASVQRIFNLTVNTAPTINGATLTVTQASPAALLTIANANDADQAKETLTINLTPLTGTGVTVGAAAVNAVGQVTANVQATCNATASTFQVTVMDALNAQATTTLTVNVTNNPAPTVGAYGDQFSAVNGTVTALPASAPADNGTVASVTATASPNTFTGSFSGDPATGELLITNAAPAGVYTVTVTVTDDCGATAQRAFTLMVNNQPMIIALGVTQMQGSPLASAAIANVSDTDQAAESLVVTVYDPAARRPNGSATINGVTVANLAINAAGVVTADVIAECKATDAEFTLSVRDNSNATATATLSVNVPGNMPSVLGYQPQMTLQGGNLTVNPLSPPTDNGSISSIILQSVTPAFAGQVVVNNLNGVVNIVGAGPVGAYTIKVLATDNCGATSTASLPLVVECQAISVSPATVPAATAQSTYSQSFSAAGAFAGSAAFSLAAGSLPNGLNLSTTGVLSGVATQTGTFRFSVKATDALGCTGVTPEIVLSVACPTVSLNPATLPDGQVGSAYQQALSGSGGTAPYTFTLANGSTLPTGLTLAANGSLIGTPRTPGSTSFVVNVTDANGCSAQRNYALNVQCPIVGITPASLPNPIIGAPYSQILTGSGGVGPYTFTLAANSALPPGLTLAGNTLSGTLTTLGTFTFTVEVTDIGLALGQVNCSGSRTFTLTVGCPTITISPNTLPNGALGAAYSQTLSASPAGTSYRYTLSNGILPSGLTLDEASGALTGTPTAAGNFSFAITATGWGSGSANCANTQSYNLLVTATCPTLMLTPVTLADGILGAAYSQALSVTGGTAPYTFAVTGGTLPTGSTLTSAGLLNGTPSIAGTFSFTVTATGVSGCTGTKSYTLVVTCPTISLTPATLPDAAVGTAYSQTFTASPAANYSFSVVGGNLPTGLSLNAATGILAGTPTVTGSFSFTLKAERTGGCSVTTVYTLAVTCPTVTISPATLPSATVGTVYNEALSATPSGNYTFALSSGALPSGLSLSAAGVLSGTPMTGGSYSFTVKATAFGNCSGIRSYTLTVTAVCTTVTLPALPAQSRMNTAYFGDLSSTTPSGSYTFTLASGNLPPGLALDNVFGALTGTPTTPGNFSFDLQATSVSGCTGIRSYTVTITSGAVALAQFADYDGDGQAEPVLWRAATGTWDMLMSAQARQVAQSWGGPGDVTLLGDYDGDGKTDLAVFRPSNATFYVKRSRDGSFLVKQWGLETDIPVPGDYDGDGKTDLAVWRSFNGTWYILRSSDQQAEAVVWGAGAAPYVDAPVAGDYDGDGKTDFGVFRRQTGTWLIKRSLDGQYLVKVWGAGTDAPVPADYDGDGRLDFAVWRGSTWFIWQSSTDSYRLIEWGASGAPYFDQAAPADYDGDGQADLAVWRSADQLWYIRCSRDNRVMAQPLGQTGDVAVAARRP